MFFKNTNIKRFFRLILHKAACCIVLALFITLQVRGISPQEAFAQSTLNLPEPGAVVPLSTAYNPAIVKGITVYPDNPLKFDFIVDPGDDNLQGDDLGKEADKLIKYFMASLTILSMKASSGLTGASMNFPPIPCSFRAVRR